MLPLQLEAATCGYRRSQPVLTGVTLCVEQVRLGMLMTCRLSLAFLGQMLRRMHHAAHLSVALWAALVG